jgi:hypothetical protein
MGLVERLGPDGVAPREVSGAGDSMPDTLPNESGSAPARSGGLSHLLPCRHCGVLNGWTAQQCWGCEASLWKDRSAGSAIEPGSAAPESAAGERLLHGGGQEPHDMAVASHGSHVMTAPAAAIDMSPVQVPTAQAAAAAAADAPLPVLMSRVEGRYSVTRLPMPAPALPATLVPSRTMPIVAAIVVVAFAGVASYLRWSTPQRGAETEDSVEAGNAKRAVVAVGRVSVEPTMASAAGMGVNDAGPADASARTIVAVPDSPVQAQPVAPADPLRMESGGPAAAMERPPVVATTHGPARATAPAMTATKSGTARAANAADAASMLKPEPLAPQRPPPPPPDPCTEAVAALGLCKAPSIRSKEFGWTAN